MKKVLLAVVLLLAVALVLVACGGDKTPETTAAGTTAATTTAAGSESTAGQDTTTTPTVVTTTPDSEPTDVTTTPTNVTTTPTDVTTAPNTVGTTPATEGVTTPSTTAPSNPEEEKVETEDYTAILNKYEWVSSGNAIDHSKFDYSGTGAEIVRAISSDYNGYKKTWILEDENGTKTEINLTAAKKLQTAGASAKADTAAKTVEVVFREFTTRLEADWKSVTARAGSYLMFNFTTNMEAGFYITVTAKEGGSKGTAAETQGDIKVSGANGKFTGVAKCTVPYAAGKTMYINICLDDGSSYPVVKSVPLTITTAKYDSEYRLHFIGEWEQVKDPEYLSNLVDLFYNVYPRLYARFAFGTEPKDITFEADKEYDGVAYCAGTRVCVSVDYANSNPRDLGFFSHEITHSVQQYGTLQNYGGKNTWKDPETGKTITCNSWWTENMANFGGFRYFHWGYSTKFVQIYNVQTQSYLWDWGYEPYGDGSKLFLSYLDWKFPSIDANGDKKLDVSEYGVIDLINYTIKSSKVSFTDHPFDPNSPFNQAVKTATKGQFDTMEKVRLQYVEDCKNKVFVFTGFGEYLDNWRTEDLPGIPNPTYPSLKPVTKGDKTAAVLETPVTDGTNIALGAKPVEFSAETGKNVFANAFDGDLTTKWQASTPKNDYKYTLGGYQHEFVIDLGEVKTFDTYTLVNAGVKENKTFNTREWELFVSEDGKTWTSVDYQKDNELPITSVNVGDTSARYVKLRVFSADRSGVGTVRLYEFMLFDQK